MKNTKRAFTLVEMLIVIVIIGILAAALIPRLVGIQSRARDTSRAAHLNQINSAVQLYAVDNVDGLAQAAAALDSLEGGYINELPTDPNGNSFADQESCTAAAGSQYSYTVSGSAYVLAAAVENNPSGNATDCTVEAPTATEGAILTIYSK